MSYLDVIKGMNTELNTQEKLFNSWCYPCRLKVTSYTARRGFNGLPSNLTDEQLMKRMKDMEACAKHFPKLLCAKCKALRLADRQGAVKL